MKIRVLSDLHIDVNSAYPFNPPKEQNEMFTVLCGDTSGNPKLTRKWIDKNMTRGVFVSGNHLVYNNQRKSIEALREQMAKDHGEDADVTYFDCMTKAGIFHKKVDGVLFVGSTLYTDFMLPLKDERAKYHEKDLVDVVNKRTSLYNMNDYHWGKTLELDGKLRPLTPGDCQDAFQMSFKLIKGFVDEALKTEPDTPVVMVTHHCPSPKCIDEIYINSDVNASYVSNLEQFIIDHPNIKLWCCGHVHHQDIIKVGECQIVMNPRGYVSRCEDDKFSSFLWVDTDDWSIHKTEKTEKEKKEYEARQEKLHSALLWFM